ncbi:MAG: energy transducer TonB [Acidobacteriota bacterium]|nr:energy transducer TonB [Acidobacteriota bacterium]
MNTQVDSGPDLLLDWHKVQEPPHYLRAGIWSVVVHLVLLSCLVALLGLDSGIQSTPTQVAVNIHKAVPLIAPPLQLTQKEPNRGKISKEVNVEDLQAKPGRTPSAPAPRTFHPPPPVPKPPAPQQQAAPRLAEPPKLEASATAQKPAPPEAGTPNAPPPPQIQTEEKPKLAFETPGQRGTSPAAGGSLSRLTPPKNTVEEAIRNVARGGGAQGGLVVGDLDPPPSIAESLRRPATTGSIKSSLELLSDPQGVDFKPYLIQVLARVRQNWLAVIPESARMGRRGRVTVQFVVDRSGSVPKLVIATPSGADPLDRAAVAGVSASVPFPPLPQDFKGSSVRLQFSFKYNVQ